MTKRPGGRYDSSRQASADESFKAMECAVLEELLNYRLGDDLRDLAQRIVVAVRLEVSQP